VKILSEMDFPCYIYSTLVPLGGLWGAKEAPDLSEGINRSDQAATPQIGILLISLDRGLIFK
jgi:hypothetical protein